MSLPSVLVIGASGLLGIHVTQELLRQRSKFARVGILTEASKRSKFEALEGQGFDIVLGSYQSPGSFKGFDTVYSLLGHDVLKDQPSIIDAAIEGGITEFYPSEFGSDISQGGYQTNLFFRDKHITRAYLEKVAKEHPRFNYTFVVVGGFIEYALNPVFGVNMQDHTFTSYGSPDKQEAVTAVADVAKYIVESTLLPKNEAGGERVFRVPGGLYSWQDIIDSISAAQGAEYTCTYLPREDAVRAALECRERGDAGGEATFSMKALMSDPNAVAVPKPWDNEKFSFHPESLQDTLARLLSKK